MTRTVEAIAGTIEGAGAIRGLKSAMESANPEDVKNAWKAAKKVEAAFLGMLLKEMRKTVQHGDLFHGGMGEDIFQGELDNAYVKSFEKGPGAGIARVYFEQLMRRSPAEASKARGMPDGPYGLKKKGAPLPFAQEGLQFMPLDRSRFEERFIPLGGYDMTF